MTASPRLGEQLELLPPEWLYDLSADNPCRLAELQFYNRRCSDNEYKGLPGQKGYSVVFH